MEHILYIFINFATLYMHKRNHILNIICKEMEQKTLPLYHYGKCFFFSKFLRKMYEKKRHLLQRFESYSFHKGRKYYP